MNDTDAEAGLSSPSRRRFLRGSAAATVFLLACHVPFSRRALAQQPTNNAPPIHKPNLFVKIDSDNWVTVISKHLEMGQGVTTGLATLLAEEMEADWSKMRFAFAPNDTSVYNNLDFGPMMGTGGSSSMHNSWEQMRMAGAAARAMLLAAAAEKWRVPEAELKAENSTITHKSGKSATFAELGQEAMQQPVPEKPALKAPGDWKLIGKQLPRIDSRGKTDGSGQFGLDVRRPGMRRAVIARPPLFGATLKNFDASASKKVPGVREVVKVPGGVAVVAEDTWSALRGRDALKVEWDSANAETRSTDEIQAEYGKLADGKGLVAANRGNATGTLASAEKKVKSEYFFPYLAHAPMEPLNGVLEFDGNKAKLWGGSQLQTIDTNVLAKTLGIEPGAVTIHTTLGGGSFGRRGTAVGDWVAELASISKAIKEKTPIQLVWTREDDIQGGYYRPMVLHRVEAGIDKDGNIAGWQHKIVTQSIFASTETPFTSFMVKDGVDHSSVEGVADTPYQIDNFSVLSYNAKSPVSVNWWRSVGNTHTAHVMETTLDELAKLAGKDPLEFRLQLLEDERDKSVLQLVAEKTSWRGAGDKRGLAFHKSFGTPVALVAEVDAGEGDFQVRKITAAVNCGTAINPDIVAAQVEGAVGFALSTLLRNQITLDKGRVVQSNFHNFIPTHIADMPEVEVHIVPSTGTPTGLGEPGLPPLAPSVGNAITAATGKRMYSMPFLMT
ncbi:xanthine dehydrogenase family protein molybdopterin-binding subunit [Microbulbifer sp. YPW16]|uniref:xanthine dehydrogenase family protein molybdopterin-binding subunit n=1 Tax=unclassified Microbulbifer TaxID=2619833 RepID=UPI001E2BEF85|nr:xanthine dehydrogenase family protein molybdopterin-binding subunit [Microbulbifer sp. YPW16]UHQ56094.1 xanthine dehydrogenase family protein molybdopterin-binding subunit [Microbulbifer sp. YPW16]